MSASPIIATLQLQQIRSTMLAVALELRVNQNADGSGTGCWILDNEGKARIRTRHGNFSFACRGGADAYWSARLVGASGSSPFYLIHHIASRASSDPTSVLFLTDSALDVSHVCEDNCCWRAGHYVCESRGLNLARRNCPGDIIDAQGVICHRCLCVGKNCVRTQNVRFQSVIARERARVNASIVELKQLVAYLTTQLGINYDVNLWSLKGRGVEPFPSYFSTHYLNWVAA